LITRFDCKSTEFIFTQGSAGGVIQSPALPWFIANEALDINLFQSAKKLYPDRISAQSSQPAMAQVPDQFLTAWP
jgi:hypothetical protein